MKSKTPALILGGIALLLIITGVVVYKALFGGSAPSVKQTDNNPPQQEVLPTVDSAISVDLVKSTATANAVVIKVAGIGSKMSSVAYELTYESKGLVKGVNSGSKPLDVTGRDTLDREIYLGTCSRNVCTPDVGITKVSVALVFTDASGKQTQFSKDYTL